MSNISYQIGYYQETCDGRAFEVVASRLLDSDAQAELEVRHIIDGGQLPTDDDGEPLRGLYIRRNGVEWFSRGI